METAKFWIFFFAILPMSSISSLLIVPPENGNVNDAPIIGVVAQEISYRLNQKWPGVYRSYIAASYIKFVEGAGARAVPIW